MQDNPSAPLAADEESWGQHENQGTSLTAYLISGRSATEITPAPRWRDWMEATADRWANRCLPLLMANESGWCLLNRQAFTATWDGGESAEAVELEVDGSIAGGSVRSPSVCSIFGYGIVTWRIPYVFRTDPGWNLLARGPANLPKDGAAALEGLIETDWATATFTMNWKLTRPGLRVRFEEREPFCMIVPQKRDELESTRPRVAPLAENDELQQGYLRWEQSREQIGVLQFVSRYGKVEGFEPKSWEQDYFRGKTVDGVTASEHRTKRRLRPFVEDEGPPDQSR